MAAANGGAEPQLPAGRQNLIELNQEMLGLDTARHSADEGLTTVSLEVAADPTEVEREVSASPLGKVLLGEGKSLLRPYEDPAEREHDLVIGDILPNAVELIASARSWRSTPAFRVSGRADYTQRHIGVGLWYGERTDDQKGDAVQYVGGGFQADTYSGVVDTAISRRVFAARRAAADRFYYGHNEKQRYVNDRKLLATSQALQRLFELRLVD